MKSLEQAKRKGIIRSVLVVDDGSTDKTSAVAKKSGFEVLRLKKNSGKAKAFYAGVRKIASQSSQPKILVLLDADLEEFRAIEVKVLIQRLIDHPHLKMVIGSVIDKETKKRVSYSESGQRAFIFSFVREPLLRRNRKWFSVLGLNEKSGSTKGYGLERGLNHLLIPQSENRDDNYLRRVFTNFVARPPRYSYGVMQGIQKASIRILERTRQAEELRRKRKLRQPPKR